MPQSAAHVARDLDGATALVGYSRWCDATREPAGPVCVGGDGSPQGRHALALGQLLADRLGAPLLAVHVATDENGEQCDASGIEADVRTVRDHSGAEGLQRVGEAENASLVVVGSSSRTGFGRVRPGETATRLYSGAPMTVAVAPAGYADDVGELSIVGCGYDGDAAARSVLQWAVTLCAARAGTKLEVLSVTPRWRLGYQRGRTAVVFSAASP